MFPFGITIDSKLVGWLGAVALFLALFLGAFLFGRSSGMRAEDRAMDPKVVAICEAVGSTWQEADKNGKLLSRAKWGRACAESARSLMKFKADAIAASAKALEDHAADEAKKTAADQADAARRSDAQAKARRDMETANAAVKNDRVDGGWFAHLNQLGGLRVAPQGEPNGARSAGQNEPPF